MPVNLICGMMHPWSVVDNATYTRHVVLFLYMPQPEPTPSGKDKQNSFDSTCQIGQLF